MANVLDFDAGDRFIATIRKSLVSSPGVRWVNRYELQAHDVGVLADLQNALSILVAAELQVHFEEVHLDQAEVATWAEDSVPYDPLAFYTEALDMVGVSAHDDPLVALDVCKVFKRQAITGRNGMVAFRGGLQTSDVVQSGTGWAYTSAGAGRTTTELNAYTGAIADLLGGDARPLGLVMITADGGYTRVVNDFVKGKIATIPMDHRWYNRGKLQPPPLVDGSSEVRYELTEKGKKAIGVA